MFRYAASIKFARHSILSHFDVNLNIPYICRNCLGKLKKRRALIEHLRSISSTIAKTYSTKSVTCVNPNAKRVLFTEESHPTKRFASEENRSQQASTTMTRSNVGAPIFTPAWNRGLRIHLFLGAREPIKIRE